MGAVSLALFSVICPSKLFFKIIYPFFVLFQLGQPSQSCFYKFLNNFLCLIGRHGYKFTADVGTIVFNFCAILQ